MKMAYTFGSRRSTNMTSPQSKSVGLSNTANNWANSSTAMKVGDQSSIKGYGISVTEVTDRGQVTLPELTEDSLMSHVGQIPNFRNRSRPYETPCANSLNLRNTMGAFTGGPSGARTPVAN